RRRHRRRSHAAARRAGFSRRGRDRRHPRDARGRPRRPRARPRAGCLARAGGRDRATDRQRVYRRRDVAPRVASFRGRRQRVPRDRADPATWRSLRPRRQLHPGGRRGRCVHQRSRAAPRRLARSQSHRSRLASPGGGSGAAYVDRFRDVGDQARRRFVARPLADAEGPRRCGATPSSRRESSSRARLRRHRDELQRAQADSSRPEMTLADLPVRRDVPAVSAAQMAEADRITIEDVRLPVEVLMENASRQVATGARAYLGSVAGKRIAAFVGSGNNGGDAVGALRHLANWGAVVHALVVAPEKRLRPMTSFQITRLLMTTNDWRFGRVTNVSSHWDNFQKYLDADLFLDGLLGYSTRGAPRDDIARAIEAAGKASCPIIAV